MGTYSFLSVMATISGPGGSVNLGQGAGAAEEGITITYEEDKDTTTTGADGSIMHSLHAGMTGTITLRLLKTSPSNAILNQMFNFQRQPTGINWGQNVIRVMDVVRGDVASGRGMAFTKHPDVSYAKDPAVMEWAFRGVVNETLGLGASDSVVP